VWLTLGADPRVVSVCSAAQRLIQEDRPCHLVWDPLTGELAQLLPIVRAGCALGTPENIDYTPDKLPHRQPGVNREGRLCVQIGVLGSPREPFTSYQMLGLGEILAWLDSWQVPRWALGGHFGASQVPDCESIGPGGIDIDQIASADTLVRDLPEPALTGAASIRLGPRTAYEIQTAPSLSAAAV